MVAARDRWSASAARAAPVAASLTSGHPRRITKSTHLIHRTSHNEALLGLLSIVAVLHGHCDTANSRTTHSPTHHRAAAGPVAIPLHREPRRRDDQTHQRLWRKATEALWWGRGGQVTSTAASMERRRTCLGGCNRYASVACLQYRH